MAATDDFFVKFGSNARTWARQLATELEPAHDAINNLKTALNDLERGQGPFVKQLQQQGPGGGGGDSGGRGRGGSVETSSMQEAVDAMVDGFREMKTELLGMVRVNKRAQEETRKLIEAIQAGRKSFNASEGQSNSEWNRQNRMRRPDGTFALAGEKGTPVQYRGGGAAIGLPGRTSSLPIDPKLTRALTAAIANQGTPTGGVTGHFPQASISAISKVQLEQGAIDRVVNAITEVRDAIKNLPSAPAGKGAAASPTEVATEAAKKVAKKAVTKEDREVERAAEREKARAVADVKWKQAAAGLAKAENEIRALEALQQHIGKGVDEVLDTTISTLSDTVRQARHDVAQLEREATGIKRSEQRTRRQKEFSERPTLTEEETEQRLLMRSRLDLALNEGALRGAVGRKPGDLQKNDLREMARFLSQELGFDVGFDPTKKDVTNERLITGIVGARRAMAEGLGSAVPEQLRTGRVLKTDELSESVTKMLSAANVTLGEAEKVLRAHEAMRAHGLAGYTPPGPFERLPAGYDTGVGEHIKVPEAMAKGGSYDDQAVSRFIEGQMSWMEAIDTLREFASSKVVDLARRPDFNPWEIQDEEIKGRGEEAQTARYALNALRRSTRELDDLAREYEGHSTAIQKAEEVLERAKNRIAKADLGEHLNAEQLEKVKTDPELIAKLEANIAEFRRQMAELADSPVFGDLKETFEDPAFKQGFSQRETMRGRWEQERVAREAERALQGEHWRQTNVSDALGHAIVGRRIAAGTKDTVIRDIPGLGYRPGSKLPFFFTDAYADRDAAELQPMATQFNRLRSRQRREAVARQDFEKGEATEEDLEKAIEKTENAATAFLNTMQDIFGYSRRVQDLLGEGRDLSEATISAQEARDQRMAAHTADLTDKKGASPSELLAFPAQRAADAIAEVAKAEEQHKKQVDRVKALEERHAKAIEERVKSLTEAEQAAVQTAQAEIEAARAEIKTLGPTTRPNTAITAEQKAMSAARKRVEELSRITEDESWHPPLAYRDPIAEAQKRATRLGSIPEEERTALDWKMLELSQKTASTGEVQPAARKELAEAQAQLQELTEKYAAEAAEREANAARYRQLAQQERAAREKLNAVLGDEPKELQKARAKEDETGEALTRTRQDRRRAADSLRGTMVDRAATRVASAEQRQRDHLRMGGMDVKGPVTPDVLQNVATGANKAIEDAVREMNRIAAEGGDLTAIKEQLAAAKKARDEAVKHQKKVADARAELGRIEKLTDEEMVKEAQQIAQDAAKRRGGKGAGLEATKGKRRNRDAVTAGSEEEAAALAEEVREAMRIKGEMSALRAKRKKLRQQKKHAEADAIQAEMDELRELPGFRTKNQRTAIRKRMAALADDGGDDAGTGGGGRGGGRGGRGGRAGGGDFGGDGLNILREILAAINKIHRQLQTGVKTSRGAVRDADEKSGEPGAPRAGRLYPGEQVVNLATRDEAKAAMAQDRLAARLKENPSAQAKIQTAALQEHEKFLKQEAEERRRAAAMTRAQARALMLLESARGNVSQATLDEVDALRRLNMEGADNLQIVQQQAKVTAMAHAEMEARGMPATARHTYTQALLSDANVRPDRQGKPVSAGAIGTEEYRAVYQTAQDMGDAIGPGGPFGRNMVAMFGPRGFWANVMRSTGQFLVRNFSAGFVFGLTNALQDIVHQAIITESTFIRVSDALEQTGRSSGNLRTQLQEISSSYGVALNDVYETAAGLTGLFDSIDEIAGATKVVAELQAISMGALTATEAMTVLASITGAYADELESLDQAADILTVIQNTLGVNVETTSEGLARMAGLSQQLKIEVADTATYVGQIAKLTGQTGAAAGEQFQRILAAMQGGRGRAVLAQEMEGMGVVEAINSGDYGEAIKALLENWDSLSDSQQRNISVTLAGQRQAAAFAALMNNSTKVLDTAARAHNANGEAQKRAEQIANTLNGQISRLQSNLQNLAQNLVRTGILSFFAGLLKAANGVLSVVNKLFSSFNDMADASPFLNFLKNMGIGLAAFVLAVKGANVALNGFLGAVRQVRTNPASMVGAGLNAAAATGGGVGVVAGAAGASPTVRERVTGGTERGAAALAARSEAAATRRATEASVGRRLALSAESRAAGLASRGVSAVGKGFANLASLGMGANIALLAVGAGLMSIISSYKKRSEFAAQIEEINKQYDDGIPLTSREQKERYVGPYTDRINAWDEERSGYGGFMMQQWVGSLNPKNWGTAAFSGSMSDQWDKYQGFLTDEMEDQIEQLRESTDEAILRATKGGSKNEFRDLYNDILKGGVLANYGAAVEGEDEVKGKLDAAVESARKRLLAVDRLSDPGLYRDLWDEYEKAVKTAEEHTDGRGIEALLGQTTKKPKRNVAPRLSEKLLEAPKNSIAEIEEAGVVVNAEISRMRSEIIAGYEKGATGTWGQQEATDQQRARALAALEEIAKENNELIASEILYAKGIAEINQLSTSQIDEIEKVRGLLQSIQGTGIGTGDALTGEGLKMLIEQTGVNPNSRVGRILDKLAEGNLTAVEAAKEDQKYLREKYTNLAAKYQAATSGEEGSVLSEEDMESLRTQMIETMTQLAAATEDIITKFISESTALADAAAAAGDYSGAAAALRAGMARVAGVRDRETETPEVRAMRDLQEQQAANQAATYRAQGQNERLQLAQARSQNATRDAQLEVQITKNMYDALLAEQALAAEAGRQGPTAEALFSAKLAWINAETAMAQQARQRQAAIAQAQASLAGAYADARGDAVGSAAAQAQAAQASIQAAQAEGDTAGVIQGQAQLVSANAAISRAQTDLIQARYSVAIALAESAGDSTRAASLQAKAARAVLNAALERSGGQMTAEVYQAQAQLIAANAAVFQAQTDLISSQVQVSIAMADAAGMTIRSSRLQLRAARMRLRRARERSGGKDTAEVNQAKAEVISAEASLRDAKLQDSLDTIDFNLQMGKITQSSAIAALREILRTQDLTKAQRRQLLLQIKGMEDELSQGMWNFGDIKMPKPYLMKRYIEEQRKGMQQSVSKVIGESGGRPVIRGNDTPGGTMNVSNIDQRRVTIEINGGDTAKVRKIVEEIVGRPGRTRTAAPRRGR